MEDTRVQLKLRGQRFEAEKAVLVEGFSFFRDFFARPHPPTPTEQVVGELAFSFSPKAEVVGGVRDVFDFGARTNEHFGSLLVSVRKGRRIFRWDELGYEQQVILASHINDFGAAGFAEYGKPTASPPPPPRPVDDDVEMPAVGCAWCGTSEHSTVDCHRRVYSALLTDCSPSR